MIISRMTTGLFFILMVSLFACAPVVPEVSQCQSNQNQRYYMCSEENDKSVGCRKCNCAVNTCSRPVKVNQTVIRNTPACADKVLTDKIIVNFKTNKYNLDNKNKIKIIKKLRAYKFFIKNITITGHADTTGNADYNMSLSQKRANNVYQFIKTYPDFKNKNVNGYILKQIPIDSPIAAGDNYSLKSNKTEQGRKENRRVEIKIYTRCSG